MSAFWRRVMTQKDHQRTLGVLRIILVATIVLSRGFRFERGLARDASLPKTLLYKNVGLMLSPFEWPIDAQSASSYTLAFWVFGLLTVVGFATRFSLASFLLVFWHTSSGASAYGFINHETLIPALVLVALLILPGTNAFSLDNLLFTRRTKSSTWKRYKGPAPPAFALSICIAVMASTYVAAGVSKLRYGGQSWLSGETLSYYLHPEKRIKGQLFAKRDGLHLSHHLYNSVETPVGAIIREVPGAPVALSLFTFVVEFGFVLALRRKHRNKILLLAFAFHMGIWFTMGIRFLATASVLIALIDRKALYAQIQSMKRRLARGVFPKRQATL